MAGRADKTPNQSPIELLTESLRNFALACGGDLLTGDEGSLQTAKNTAFLVTALSLGGFNKGDEEFIDLFLTKMNIDIKNDRGIRSSILLSLPDGQKEADVSQDEKLVSGSKKIQALTEKLKETHKDFREDRIIDILVKGCFKVAQALTLTPAESRPKYCIDILQNSLNLLHALSITREESRFRGSTMLVTEIIRENYDKYQFQEPRIEDLETLVKAIKDPSITKSHFLFNQRVTETKVTEETDKTGRKRLVATKEEPKIKPLEKEDVIRISSAIENSKVEILPELLTCLLIIKTNATINGKDFSADSIAEMTKALSIESPKGSKGEELKLEGEKLKRYVGEKLFETAMNLYVSVKKKEGNTASEDDLRHAFIKDTKGGKGGKVDYDKLLNSLLAPSQSTAAHSATAVGGKQAASEIGS